MYFARKCDRQEKVSIKVPCTFEETHTPQYGGAANDARVAANSPSLPFSGGGKSCVTECWKCDFEVKKYCLALQPKDLNLSSITVFVGDDFELRTEKGRRIILLTDSCIISFNPMFLFNGQVERILKILALYRNTDVKDNRYIDKMVQNGEAVDKPVLKSNNTISNDLEKTQPNMNRDVEYKNSLGRHSPPAEESIRLTRAVSAAMNRNNKEERINCGAFVTDATLSISPASPAVCLSSLSLTPHHSGMTRRSQSLSNGRWSRASWFLRSCTSEVVEHNVARSPGSGHHIAKTEQICYYKDSNCIMPTTGFHKADTTKALDIKVSESGGEMEICMSKSSKQQIECNSDTPLDMDINIGRYGELGLLDLPLFPQPSPTISCRNNFHCFRNNAKFNKKHTSLGSSPTSFNCSTLTSPITNQKGRKSSPLTYPKRRGNSSTVSQRSRTSTSQKSPPSQPPRRNLKDSLPAYKFSTFSGGGLVNFRNSCWLNAVMQCLCSLSSLTDLLCATARAASSLRPPSTPASQAPLLFSTAHLLEDLRCQDKTHMSDPASFRDIFSLVCPNFSGFNQQDAHEFLVQLFDKLEEEMQQIVNSLSVKFLGDNRLLVPIHSTGHAAKTRSRNLRSCRTLPMTPNGTYCKGKKGREECHEADTSEANFTRRNSSQLLKEGPYKDSIQMSDNADYTIQAYAGGIESQPDKGKECLSTRWIGNSFKSHNGVDYLCSCHSRHLDSVWNDEGMDCSICGQYCGVQRPDFVYGSLLRNHVTTQLFWLMDCCACKYARMQPDAFKVLSLPLPHANNIEVVPNNERLCLPQLLDEFFSTTEAELTCEVPTCRSTAVIRRPVLALPLPPVIILHIQRNMFHGSARKNCREVLVPSHIQFAKWTRLQESKCSAKREYRLKQPSSSNYICHADDDDGGRLLNFRCRRRVNLRNDEWDIKNKPNDCCDTQYAINQSTQSVEVKDDKYTLRSAVVHIGSDVNFGHFVTYVKVQANKGVGEECVWEMKNDTYSRQVQMNGEGMYESVPIAVHRQGYLLFYSRRP